MSNCCACFNSFLIRIKSYKCRKCGSKYSFHPKCVGRLELEQVMLKNQIARELAKCLGEFQKDMFSMDEHDRFCYHYCDEIISALKSHYADLLVSNVLLSEKMVNLIMSYIGIDDKVTIGPNRNFSIQSNNDRKYPRKIMSILNYGKDKLSLEDFLDLQYLI